jgi:putative acetyltransferase
MNPPAEPWFLRPEQPADAGELDALIRSAFAQNPHSRQTEAAIVGLLREARALALSLVVQAGSTQSPGPLLGHAAFVEVTISGGACGWFGLGPLSVLPPYQGAGIGAELVRQGLRALQQQGASGCVVLGEPAYYGRFGFRSTPALQLPGAPPGCFLIRPFARVVPMGTVSLHSAFQLAPAQDWTFP